MGGMGGLLDGSDPPDELAALLTGEAGDYRWAAAAVGANNAAGYQLATGLSVMPVGGFNGTDPSPTLEQFQEYVATGQIRFFLGGGDAPGGGAAGGGGPGGGDGIGGGGQNGGSGQADAIAAWVAETFTAQTVGGVTVYDLGEGVQ
jgi:hypothetical protein